MTKMAKATSKTEESKKRSPWPLKVKGPRGLEFTHAKAYADNESRNALGFERLELTHGLASLTPSHGG